MDESILDLLVLATVKEARGVIREVQENLHESILRVEQVRNFLASEVYIERDVDMGLTAQDMNTILVHLHETVLSLVEAAATKVADDPDSSEELMGDGLNAVSLVKAKVEELKMWRAPNYG